MIEKEVTKKSFFTLAQKKAENVNIKRNQRIIGMRNKEAMKSTRRSKKYLINKEVMKLGMHNKEVLRISRSTQQGGTKNH